MTESSFDYEKIGPVDGVTTIVIKTPEIFKDNSGQVGDTIRALLEEDSVKIDVDCRNITFFDSTAISTFLMLTRVSDEIRFVNQPEVVQHPLRVTGLDIVLPNVVTVEGL